MIVTNSQIYQKQLSHGEVLLLRGKPAQSFLDSILHYLKSCYENVDVTLQTNGAVIKKRNLQPELNFSQNMQ